MNRLDEGGNKLSSGISLVRRYFLHPLSVPYRDCLKMMLDLARRVNYLLAGYNSFMETIKLPVGQTVILHGVSWKTYESLLADHTDRSVPRFAYDQGELEIVSPSPKHEKLNRGLALLVEVVAEEFGIDVYDLGSTTFKREDLERGFEPDSCFYVQNEERVRGKDRIDLETDPPPDLVIEIDITSPSLDKHPI